MKPSTKNTIKRALVSIAVFAAIYLLSGPIIGWTGYDMNLKGIEFLSAVVGAGCYWIGSNQRYCRICRNSAKALPVRG